MSRRMVVIDNEQPIGKLFVAVNVDLNGFTDYRVITVVDEDGAPWPRRAIRHFEESLYWPEILSELEEETTERRNK